jgi:biopolymer transport protein ExbB
MQLIRRLPALLAAIILACAPAAPIFFSGAAHAQAPAADAAKAAEPAKPAPPPAAAAKDKETIENPYGLEALWRQGDFVSKGTLIILVIMSMGSWYILFVKVYEQYKLFREASAVKATFWSSGSVAEGAATMKDGSPFKFIAESALEAQKHHEGKLLETIDYNEWVTMGIQRAVENVGSRLQDGLAFLATVGSTAPFVGLFGTVWGIYHALTAIGIAGQASIDKVAGPVGEALIMTALGLAVAIPAVLAYNAFVRANRVVLAQLDSFAHDLYAVLVTGARLGERGTVVPVKPPLAAASGKSA